MSSSAATCRSDRPRGAAILCLWCALFTGSGQRAFAIPSPSDSASAAAQTPADLELLEDLRVGHWVEVRGAVNARSVSGEPFQAARLEVRPPGPKAELWGVATAAPDGKQEFEVLGRRVVTDERTRWRPAHSNLLGQRVRVRGEAAAGERFFAAQVQVRDPGVERIVGRVDALVARRDGSLELGILGFTVLVPHDVKQRLRLPADERTAGAEQALDLSSRTWRVPPRPLRSAALRWEDPDDFFGRGFELSPQVRAEVQQELVLGSRRNLDLDQRDDSEDLDDLDDASHQLRARFTWLPGPKTLALVDVSHRLRHRDAPPEPARTEAQERLREAWVLLRDVGFGLDLQVGRQDVDEPREWLFDESLDALRLFKQTRKLNFQLSLSTSLDTGLESSGARNRAATNAILYVANTGSPRHLASYVVHRHFGDGRDERQTHLGVRALGEVVGNWRGWAELSHLDGHRRERPVSAWAADIGTTWRSDAAHRTSFTVAYAWSTGDRGGPTDGRFRQTGLQDNNARLGGISAVRYYGELMNPELSNLQIATLGIASRFSRRSSLELIAHTYRQSVASTRLTNTDLERRPNGLSDDLGWEIDAVIGIRRFEHWDLELTGAYFQQGSAFDSGESATLARLQIRYRY